jgi:hypothetical protein
VNQCDFGCCCDTKCASTDFELTGTQCPIRHRRVYEKIIDQWTCNDIFNQPKFTQPDWFPIVCIHVICDFCSAYSYFYLDIMFLFFLKFNTSVLLGNFYSPKSLNELINDKEKFQTKLKNAFDASYNTRSKYLSEFPRSNT